MPVTHAAHDLVAGYVQYIIAKLMPHLRRINLTNNVVEFQIVNPNVKMATSASFAARHGIVKNPDNTLPS